MNELILIHLKSTFALILFCSLFYSVNRRNTIVTFNRYYLLSISILVMVMPFLKFTNAPEFVQYYLIPQSDEVLSFTSDIISTGSNPDNSVVKTILLIYIIGALIFLTISLIRILNILRLISRNEIKYIHGHKIVALDDESVPFTFFNLIFLNPKKYNTGEIDILLKHEDVHIRQYHTIDLILYEMMNILFWYNPLVYYLRKKLNENHEFLADKFVLASGTDRHNYINLLLNHTGYKPFLRIGNNFSQIITAKRITMMKTKSPKKHLRIIVTSIIVVVVISLGFTFGNSCNEYNPISQSSLLNPSITDDNQPSIPPIELSKVKMTSEFGMRIHPIHKREVMHKGIDLAAATGTSVFATANGIVTQTGFEENGAGNYIVIYHDNTFETFYSQLIEILVIADQEVTKGTVIGKVGSSGLSTGPHLHYEVRLNGEAVDPSNYFE